MVMKALELFFAEELTELYDAERQIVKALPKMAQAAQLSKLRESFELHLAQTQHHIERLEQIFKALESEPGGLDSGPVAEIIKQGDTIIASTPTESALVDAALISAAQKVEHYEIALYGSALTHAETLGYTEVAAILRDTLREEEDMDAILTAMTDKVVNGHAPKTPPSRARAGWGIGGLIAGAAIGAGIALLCVPKPGGNARS
jgi:ferritin-like metal-binding protein YciE